MAERMVRCAIYTRKSTEEGLEQAFNSLDAQREACAAYIASQKHEGWQLLPDLYDDGGYSGGTMERPGLKQLMTEVAARRVDVIVVYKVDRLTRSLADFARIVDVLDKTGASFVSVTQAFNTTTSMGRLTLNVLLSFAQFEREVTGERIRDKVAASKQKGMWMGGPIPLGYDLHEHKLTPNEVDAATVRYIFERYAALGSMGLLEEELADAGVRTKARIYKDGRHVGGIPFTIGPLAHLLNNPIYVGEVRHKGQRYAGQHEAIIDRGLWDQVHEILARNRVDRRIGGKGTAPSLLTGMVCDGGGRIMSPTYAIKGTRRYRYYVSRGRAGDRSRLRVPAGELERCVIDRLVDWLGRFADEVGTGTAYEQQERLADARLQARELAASTMPEQRAWLMDRNARVTLTAATLRIELDHSTNPHSVPQPVTIETETALVDRGSDVRLVIAADGSHGRSREPDPVLVKLIVQAFAARDAMIDGATNQLTSDYSPLHRSRLARLSYLAPDIVTAIIEGRQPQSLNGRRLLRAASLPVDWTAQRQMLGFASH